MLPINAATRGSRSRSGFTLLEVIAAVLVVAILAGVGLVSYTKITANTRRDQAKTLLTSVATSQQAWYRSKGSFVAFTTASGPGRTETEQLLKRIGPGTAEVPASYVDAGDAATAFGKISLGLGVSNNWALLAMTTKAATGECVGNIVAPSGSGIAGYGPEVTPEGALATCSASDLLAWRNLEGSSTGPGTTAPGAPRNPTLTPGPGRIVLTWDAPESDGTNDPTSYEVRTTAPTRATLATIEAGVTSFVHGSYATPLDPKKSYGYEILARNATGASMPVAFTPATLSPLDPSSVAPTKPAGLRATYEFGQVHLRWAAQDSTTGTAATGYEIARDGTTIACLGDANICRDPNVRREALSVELYDSAAARGARYGYTLRALNPAGTSAWSATSIVTPPAAPTGLTARALDGQACEQPACVTLSWTAPAAPPAPATAAPLTGYRVYRCDVSTCDPAAGSGGAQLVATTTAAETTYTAGSLPGALGSRWKVVAFNANSEASTLASSNASANTVAQAPTVTGAPAAGAKITLTWAAPKAIGTITGYDVYRVTDGKMTKLARTTATTFSDTGADQPDAALEGYTVYSYAVAAVTADGAGIPSAVVDVRSGSAPLTSFVQTGASESTITMSWKRAPGIEYRIYSNTDLTPDAGGLLQPNAGARPRATTGTGSAVVGTFTAGSTGTWHLLAYADGDTTSSASSPARSVQTLGSAPTGVSATGNGKAITIAWSPTTGARGYVISRCAGTSCTPDQVIARPANQTSYTDTGLAADTAYTYTVATTTLGGVGKDSAPATGATIPLPVSVTSSGTPKTVSLDWSASPVATSYAIYRGGVWVATLPAGTTTWSDADIVGGVTYSYVVRAQNGAGSADSAPTQAQSAPDPPTGLRANPGATKVDLTWLSQGADAYQVLRCAGRTCTPSTVVATVTDRATLAASDTGLAAQSWYTYAVRAGRALPGGGYTWSSPSGAVTTKTVLDAPEGLTVTATTGTTATLTWKASVGAAGYNVYRDGVKVTYTNGNVLAVTTSGLTPGTSYTYTVTARAANNEESGQSTPVVATTTLTAPTGVAVTATSTSSITLTWAAVDGASGYEVLGCATPCSTRYVLATTATTSATVDSLPANTEHSLTVRARTTAVVSAESTPVSGWTRPAAPEAPTTGAITDTTIALSWPSVPNALRYTLARDGVTIATVTAPATSFVDGKSAPLEGGSTYAYTLTVTNAGGESAASAATSATTLPSAPEATVVPGWRQAAISWPAVKSATGYELYRCPGATCDASTGFLVTTTAATVRTFTNTGLADAADYRFAVRALSATGPGPFSAPALAHTAPQVPGAPSASATTSQGADLTWEATPNQLANGTGDVDAQRWSVANGTVERVTDTVRSGEGALLFKVKTDLAVPTQAYLYGITANGALPLSNATPIAPGQRVTATYWVRGYAASPSEAGAFPVNLGVIWYGNTGTSFSSSQSANVVLSTSGWTKLEVTATAPAGTHRIIPVLYDRRAGGAKAGDGWYVDDASVVLLDNDATSYSLFRGASLATTSATPAASDTGLDPATRYSYTATASNASASSVASPAGSVVTRPAGVTNLRVAAATDTTADLTWTAASGEVTGYQVRRDGVLVADLPATTSYTLTGLAANTAYTVTVAARTASGLGEAVSVAVRTTPAAPVSLTATAGPGRGATSLTWGAVTGATGYQVLRDGVPVASPTGTTFADTALADARAYTYQVIAIGAGGSSPRSAAVTVTTLPAAPTGLSATASGTTVTLTWTAPAGAVTGYRIYRCTGTSCTPTTQVATGTATTFTDTDAALAAGSTYRYAVAAVTAGGVGAATAPVTIALIPSTPTGLAASAAAGKVTLTWNAATNASSYQVLRCSGTGCTPTTVLATTAGLGHVDTTVAGGTTYTYAVRALNAAGSSAASAGVTVLTIPDAPLVTVSDATPTSLTLSWTPADASATGFKVYNGTTLVATLTGATRSYVVTGLSPNTEYTHTLTALNASGESAKSAGATARTTVAVPTGLSLSSVDDTTATFTWTAVPGATGYRLYAPGATTVAITSGATTTATLTGLNPGTRYDATLTALGTGFESAPTAAVPATTTIGAPAGLAVTAGVRTAALSWTAVPGAAGYKVYRCAGAACAPTTLVATLTPGSTTSWTDSALSDGTTYRYAVATYTADFTSPAGSPVEATTAPAAPASPVVTAVTDTTATLTWNASTAATGYRVFSGSTQLWSGTTTTTTLTGLTPGTLYTWGVAAYNGAGQSAQAPFASVRTRPAAVTADLTPGYRTVTVTWPASPSATGYTVYGCTTTGCTPSVSVGTTTTTTTLTWSVPTDNTPASVRIGASNASGESLGAIVRTTTLPALATGTGADAAAESATAVRYTRPAGTAVTRVTRDGALVAQTHATDTILADSGADTLRNSGYEQPLGTYPGITNDAGALLSIDPAEAHSGSSSLRVQTNRSDVLQGVIHDTALPAQQVSPAGSTYAVNSWFKGPAGVQFAVSARNLNTSGTNMGYGPGVTFTATGDWQLVSAPMLTTTQPGAPGLRIRLATAATGIVFWLDDAHAASTGLNNLAPADVATGTETTGTTSAFSAGTNTTLSSSTDWDASPATGRSLRIAVPATSTQRRLTVANMPVNPGVSIQLATWSRLAATGPDATTQSVAVRAQLQFKDASGAVIGGSVGTGDAATLSSDVWTRATTLAANAPASAASVDLVLLADGTVSAITAPVAVFTDAWFVTADLHPNTSHAYTLATGDSGYRFGPATAAFTGVTDPTPVVGLTSTTTSPATVTWSPHPDAASYQVSSCSYAAGGTCTMSAPATVTTPDTLVRGMSADDYYCLEVAVVATSGAASLPSRICNRVRPTSPTGLTVTATSTTSITLSWDALPATDNPRIYQVRRTTTGGATSSWCTATTATSCTLTGLSAGTTYLFAVRGGTSANGYSNYSADITAATDPAAPTLTGSASGTTATLSWTSAGPDTTYAVRRNGVTLASGLTGLSYTDSTLGAGATASYQVIATNNVAATASSNNLSLTTIPPSPTTAPGVVETSAHTFALTLAPRNGATSYTICRAAGAGTCTTVATISGGQNSWNDVGPFTGGVSYSYRYSASNAAGTSALSPATAIRLSYEGSVATNPTPEAYWRLGERPASSGTPLLDDVRPGNADANSEGAPIYGPGLSAGSLSSIDFAGRSRGAVTNLPAMSVTATSSTTVEFTAEFPASPPAGGTQPFAFKGAALYMNPTGHFGFNAGSGSIYGLSATDMAPFMGGTHHVVAVFKNGANLNTANNGSLLYIDGKLQTLAVQVSRTATVDLSAKQITIGGAGNSTGQYWYPWPGAVDNVGIFNGALSAATVTTHYNATNQATAMLASSPVAFYPMESAVVTDATGKSATGRLLGDPATVGGAPLGMGTVGSLGVSPGSRVVPAPTTISSAAGAKTTFEAVVRFPSGGSSFLFNGGTMNLWQNGTQFGFNTTKSDIYGIDVASLAGQTHRVTAVFVNGSVTSSRLYIDGVLQTLSQLRGTPNTSPTFVDSALLSFGGTPDGRYIWNAGIADAALWPSELTAARIAAHQSSVNGGADNAVAVAADSPTWFYRLNDFSAKDASGNGRYATIDPRSATTYGTAGAIVGDTDTAMTTVVNGTGDDLPLVPSTRYSGEGLISNGPRTVNFWLRNPTLTDQATWVYQGDATGGVRIGLGASAASSANADLITFEHQLPGGTVTTKPMAAPGIATGWHMVTVVMSNLSVTLYVDGVKTGFASLSRADAPTSDLYLGGSPNPAHAGAPAGMDEVAWWNVGLSAAQVSAMYAASR